MGARSTEEGKEESKLKRWSVSAVSETAPTEPCLEPLPSCVGDLDRSRDREDADEVLESRPSKREGRGEAVSRCDRTSTSSKLSSGVLD